MASELGVDQLEVSTLGNNQNGAILKEATKPYMFEGWRIQRGRISKITNVNGEEIKVVVAGESGTAEPELRFYPNVKFTRNGETRVRYAFDRELNEDDSYEFWPTVLKTGRSGYVVFPVDDPSYDYYAFENNQQLTMELIDRSDRTVERTFSIENLKSAFDKMRRTYPELAIGWREKYMIRFETTPAEAQVALNHNFLFTWISADQLTGATTVVDLEQGRYRYTGTLAGHLNAVGEFWVPDTTIVNIELSPLSGAQALEIASGTVTPEIFGEDLWPLRVDTVTLACEGPDMAIVNPGDEQYALNRAAEDIYPSVEPLLARGYDLEDVVPLSDLALTLCRNDD